MIKTIVAKKIGVFGYGLEGRSLVTYLLKHGARDITVFDEAKVKNDRPNSCVKYIHSDFEKNLYDIELAFRSPGINLARLKNILGDKVEISSATNLFFKIAKGRKIIITGTKGKSTTVSLVKELLELNGLKVRAGGNLGKCPLDFVDSLDDDSYTILELSSFQLQDFNGKADFCLYLPIVIDHLDYHKDFEEYFLSKKKAIGNFDSEGIVVLPKDHLSDQLLSNFKGKYFYYSLSRPIVDKGCFVEGDDCKCFDSNAKIVVKDVIALSRDKKIPFINLVASITLLFSMKMQINLEEALKKFKKPKYRMERLDSKSGLVFYNDSASTNPISTIEAIRLMDKPFAIIMGGYDKGLKYNSLAGELARNTLVRGVFLFGKTAKTIKEDLATSGFKRTVICLDSLDEILNYLSRNKKGLGSILFSPASSSFDQFDNYQQRGQVFDSLVKKYFK